MAATYSYGSAPTYTKIASNTLSTASTSYTFSNIPQTYTDLVLVTNTRSHTGQASYDTRIYVNLNGDQTSGLYSGTVMHGTGVNAVSYRETGRNQVDNSKQTSTQSSGEFAPFIYNIMNYSNPNIFKNVIQRASPSLNTESTYNGPGVAVTLWRNLSPITSLTVQAAGGASSVGFAAGSSFTLYGIKAALVPKATGGDLIRTDGTYWIHTFTNSGSFIPRQNLTVDYLVVAGGGSGGSYAGGGGGAGGLRSTVTTTGGGGSLESALSLSSGTNYTVTVGAGGAAVNNRITAKAGIQGSNSVFSTITATGGGGGGSYANISPTTGGSGGGSPGYSAGASVTGAAGTASQGYAGGSATSALAGAGGGGSGAVGATVSASSTVGGAGGAGVAVSITGTSVTYAGGGGGAGLSGGAGGSGGGGTAGNGTSTPGTSGTVNTGGGGGGVRDSTDTRVVISGAGGSGLVIVRYAV